MGPSQAAIANSRHLGAIIASRPWRGRPCRRPAAWRRPKLRPSQAPCANLTAVISGPHSGTWTGCKRALAARFFPSALGPCALTHASRTFATSFSCSPTPRRPLARGSSVMRRIAALAALRQFRESFGTLRRGLDPVRRSWRLAQHSPARFGCSVACSPHRLYFSP